ncbi:MAG: heavy metal translocating P-type ATPase [Eubacteriaceae bacterium]
MKLYLEGLNCANCAGKIEKIVSKFDGVAEASISLATGALSITEEKGFEEEKTYEAVVKLVKELEPDVVVAKTKRDLGKTETCNCGENHSKKEHYQGDMSRRKKIELTSAIGLFIFGFLLQAILPEGLEFISIGVFLGAYFLAGYDVIRLAFKNIGHGQIFDENFLMTIATFGALILMEWPEAAGVMIFFGIGEYFQDKAVDNARRSIAKAINFNANTANRITSKGIVEIDAKEVKVGDVLVIKPGEKVPADGKVLKGMSYIDTSPLTGESYPRKVEKGDEVLSGMINGSEMIQMLVTKDYENSTAMRIIHLIEEANDKKGKTEKFITKFSRFYTPIVVFLALGMAILPPLLIPGALWETWFYQSLIFLVVSCPCALVLSIPISYFGGIGRASKEGILIKGGNYLDVLYGSNVFVFDKTGTLTKGEFKVLELKIPKEVEKKDVLELGNAGEYYSNHPIGKAIKCYEKTMVLEKDIQDYQEIPGKGTKVIYKGRPIYLGNRNFLLENGIKVPEMEENGTVVYLGRDQQYMGSFLLGDESKPNAKITLEKLKKRGIKENIMLSGDNLKTAKSVGEKLGLDRVIGDCLPEDKVKELEKIMETNKKGKTIYVGDGMNDAPVLALADAGIAMGGLGSDAAIEAADIILMKDDPLDIVKSVDIAKFTRKIMIQNIVLALGIKIFVLGLTVLGLGELYLAIFADVGAAILTILNTSRILKYRGK